jgi:Uma2 family endonuclease
MPGPQIETFTAADYRLMPEDGKRYQLIEGELIVAPAPNTFHQFVQRNLLTILQYYLLKNPIGTVLGAPCDVYLDEHNVYQPDILYLTREHAARIQLEGIHGAPDLAIEILSPSTAGLDRRKRGHFAAAGTLEFWQIDPALRQIQRFVFAKNVAKPIELIDEPETFTSSLFPDLTLATGDIFRR